MINTLIGTLRSHNGDGVGNESVKTAIVFGPVYVGSGGPQVGEVTHGGSPYLSCKRDQMVMRDYMDR